MQTKPDILFECGDLLRKSPTIDDAKGANKYKFFLQM